MTTKGPLLRRRDVLRGGTAAAFGLTFGGCSRDDPYALKKPPVPGAERWTPHQEREFATACGQCPAGCGIRVRVVEGRAVGIRPQPGNPIHGSGIGPRGLAGTQVLYDPDRIHQPLRRRGARGSGPLEAVSWDEALDELGRRLSSLRSGDSPHALGILCGRDRGLMWELWGRFAASFGTPNFIDVASRKRGALADAVYWMQGVREVPVYDWQSARYVLSIGSGLLEESCQSIHFARSTVHHRLHRGTERGYIVHVEPSRSRTAASADEWVPIAPGTHTSFVLGVAHALVKHDLYDQDFVEQHGFGFDEWSDEAGRLHPGLRSVLLAEYPPERIARVCEVPSGTFERIARELVDSRPGFAVTRPFTTMRQDGLQLAMAVHALNALLGAIDRPGGVRVPRSAPLAPWPDVEPDEIARRGRERTPIGAPEGGSGLPPVADDLPAALLAGDRAPLDTLLLYYANPCHAAMEPDRWRRALLRVPFVATFTPFLDETASEVADLVLPDHTYFERWEDSASAPVVGQPVFGVRQPVVAPQHDTRATGDVILDLAKRVGETVARDLPWRDFRTALFQRASGLAKAKGGSIPEARGSAFLRRLFEQGFWTAADSPYERWSEVLRTPSGRFEFHSLRLREALRSGALRTRLERRGITIDEDRLSMPLHREPDPVPDADAYPLVLEVHQPGTYAEGSGANLPLLQEIVTDPHARPWKTVATMHPRTAERHGLRAGERVRVESPVGHIEIELAVHPDIRPGSLRIPRGGGHRAFGRFAEGRGANVMQLVPARTDPFAGVPQLHGVRVRIQRVGA